MSSKRSQSRGRGSIRSLVLSFVASPALASLALGCGAEPPPAAPPPMPPIAEPPPAAAPALEVAVPTPPTQAAESHDPAEPLRATDPRTPRGSVVARLASSHHVGALIDTDLGTIECDLFRDRAPKTVENFVGLATGEKTWLDPRSGQKTNQPAYDGTSFHRVIAGFMIQGGDPKGDGSGEPGFTIPDEIWPGAKHDRAGLLCMANRGKDTNGAQFFITDASAPHLDGGYTIFGECRPLDVVHRIANEPTGAGSKPTRRVGIRQLSITVD